jgi:hypothetical protein
MITLKAVCKVCATDSATTALHDYQQIPFSAGGQSSWFWVVTHWSPYLMEGGSILAHALPTVFAYAPNP